MLLEVQNISKAAVVLGNTWAVNAVIISGVMVMILAGEPDRRQVPATAAAAGLRPARALVHRPLLPRPVAVRVPALRDEGCGGRACSRACPCSSAASCSSDRSRRRERKDAALGANLIGALVGGLLQTMTFVTGIKALLLDRRGAVPRGGLKPAEGGSGASRRVGWVKPGCPAQTTIA